MNKDPFFLPFLIIIFSYINSAIFAIDKYISFWYIFFFVSGYTIYRFMLEFSLKDEEFFRKITVMISIYIFIVLLIALVQLLSGRIQLFGLVAAAVSTPFKEGIRRIRGVYMHANSLGGIIGLYLPFLFTLLLSGKERFFSKKNIGVLLFILFSVFLLYNTHSRNGYVSAFLGITFSTFLMIIKAKKLNIFLRYIFIMIPLILIVYILINKASPFLIIRIKAMLNPSSDIAISERLMMWKNSIREFSKHPLIGIGIANFPYMPFSLWLNAAHNHYINLLIETGIWGVIGYILLYFVILYNLIKIWIRTTGDNFIIVNGLIGGWVVYLTHCFFDTSFHNIIGNEEMKTFFLFLFITSYFILKLGNKKS